MFRRQKISKKLSAEELKTKLYDHFDKSGSINQLRTQIRSQLVSELFKMAPPSTTVSNQNETVDLDNTLLPLQVCNWLVYDHLLRQGYQYSLSTFVSETNLPNPEKLLTVGDILGLFGLDNSNPESNKIIDFYSNSSEKGNLHSLLLAIIKSVVCVSEKDKQIETLIDPSQQAFVRNEISSSGAMYAQKTVPGVVKNMSTNKISNSTEFNDDKSLESSYHEQLQLVKEEKEHEIQSLRHKLLQELDRLHSHEHTLHQEIEQERKELRKERDLIFNEREKLKEKENMCIKEHENKLQRKIREIEEVNITKLHSKEKELDLLREELREKERKLGHSDYELSSHRESFNSLMSELDGINQMYKSVHEKYNTLLDENTNLVRKFEKMSDYNVLKEELSSKSSEIIVLKQKIENLDRVAERNKKSYTETVSSLELKLKATEQKLHQIQKELNQTRDTLHLEETLWGNEKTRLEQESFTSKELYKTVLQRIEEQKQDIHDLHQTIHVLHYQLTSENASRAANLHSYDPLRTVPKVPFLQPKNNLLLKSSTNNPIALSQKYREKALNFTSDYKSRLNKLQQEVEAGIDKYSLISGSSLDSKMPNVKPYLSRSPLNFAPSTKLGNPSFTFSNLDSEKALRKLRTATDLNLKYDKGRVPSFLYRNNYIQSSEIENSAEAFYDNSKSFAINGERELTSITSKAQKSVIGHQFEASETLKPNFSFQKFPHKQQPSDKFQITPFPSNITSPTKLYANNSSVREVETISTGITEETVLSTSVTKTEATESVSYIDSLDTKPTPFSSSSDSVSIYESTCSNHKLLCAAPKLNIKGTFIHQESTPFAQNACIIPTDSLKPLNTNLSTETSVDSSHSLKQSGATFTAESASVLSSNSLIQPLTTHVTESVSPMSLHSLKQPVEPSAAQSVSHDTYKQSVTAPVVVDLDAAWKRKTSLPTLPPSLFKEPRLLILPTTSTANDETSESKVDIKLNSPNFKSQDAVSCNNTQSTIVVSNTKILPNAGTQGCSNTMSISNILTPSPNDDIHVKPYCSDSPDNHLTHSPTEAVKESVSKSKLEKQANEENFKKVIVSSDTDEEVKVKRKLPDVNLILNETKTEDSLSELSEVHMSHGSEQEEQKEESDNW